MNQLQVFQNSEFGELGVLEIDCKPYFPAKAAAKILGYKDTTNAIKQHCRWVVKHHLPHPQSPGKTLPMNFIPEGDLYRLITHSKLPAAERFEKWVFDEVLPSIRKTGGYGMNDQTAVIMQTAIAVCAEMVKRLTPLFQTMAHPPVMEESMILESETDRRRFRKKPASIIDKLCPELRKDVEEMLCDGRYTYADVVTRLGHEGIKISTASVCRYAQRNNCYSVYEVSEKN